MKPHIYLVHAVTKDVLACFVQGQNAIVCINPQEEWRDAHALERRYQKTWQRYLVYVP